MSTAKAGENVTIILTWYFSKYIYTLVHQTTYLYIAKVIYFLWTVFFLASFSLKIQFRPGVVTCNCNPATLDADFPSFVVLIQDGSNSPSIGGWIVWPPVIQHKEKSLNKYRNLTLRPNNEPRFQVGLN